MGYNKPMLYTPRNRPRGWHSRGYLPHFDGPGRCQFITYRLADSLPRQVLDRLTSEAAQEPEANRQRSLWLAIDRYLDAGHGEAFLTDPVCAQVVIDTWRHFDGERYELLAWVVMPNHVHVVVHPYPDSCLAGIINGWKTFSARRINEQLGRRGSCWMLDYWDRYVQDEEHLQRVIAYVEHNPVTAGLCEKAEEWPWSSAACDLVGRAPSR